MAKTLVEKVSSPNPDVSIFKISGVLGYHENGVLEKFFAECRKKSITKLIVDFEFLGSLGGGCAKIIRETAAAGEIVISVVGASKTVQNFLENKGETRIVFVSSVEHALEQLAKVSVDKPGPARASRGRHNTQRETEHHQSEKRLPQSPSGLQEKRLPQSPPVLLSKSTDVGDDASNVAVALEIPEKKEAGSVKQRQTKSRPRSAPAEDPSAKGAGSPKRDRDLERKLVQYRSLFSLNSDFSRIHEKSRLLDAFLLTTIAQAGVECAAFLERSNGAFRLVAWKGFETGEPAALEVAFDDINAVDWIKSPRIFHVDEDDAPIKDGVKARLRDWDLPFVAPFIVHGQFQGVVLLGHPIRKNFDSSTLDYLIILINQAAIAYQNSCLFEEESKRTLGLVQSLIAMIEDNTLARGSTEDLVNYTYAVAVGMNYPEEHIRDLVYGTVLRDIGMIKVSDLIVRKSKELVEEEWEIIKRHPVDGSEMLRKMRFSEQVCNIVLCHHERFDGQGYPNKLQGAGIPLGARIVSVVESYAMMLQDRSTRPALPKEQALSALKENWGTRYDPEVVEEFVDIVEEEIRTGQMVRYDGSEQFRD